MIKLYSITFKIQTFLKNTFLLAKLADQKTGLMLSLLCTLSSVFMVFYFIVVYCFPFIFNIFEKSYISTIDNEHRIIYKGKELTRVPSDCLIKWTEGFDQVTVLCNDKKSTWRNGKLVDIRYVVKDWIKSDKDVK